jgi:hypothetical protein
MKDDNQQKQSNLFAKYGSMVAQIAIPLLIAVYLGGWLDEKAGLKTPYITLSLIFLSLIGSFYKVYIQVSQDEKQ